MKNLDIIIPTHNELDSLDELFSRVENIVLSIQKDKNINIGVIIIDDSTDETIDHLNDYADKKIG